MSQTGAALRTVEHKLWDWDEVVARVSALDELVKRVHEPLQKQSVRVMNVEHFGEAFSENFNVCLDRVTNLEQWAEELAASL